jgi:hypothetical protein
LWATAAKQTKEQLLLVSRKFLISKNGRPLLGKSSENTFMWQWIRMRTVPRYYKEDSSVCEVGSLREAVKNRVTWKRVGIERSFREDLDTEAEE